MLIRATLAGIWTMAGTDWLEVFKVVGSAAGLISSGVFAYDRLMRIRPEVFLSVGEYPGNIDLTVKNVSNETLVVDEVGVSPNILGLAKDDSVEGIVTAVMNRNELGSASVREVFLVFKPLEEKQLKVVMFQKLDELPAAQKVLIRLSWRTTRDRLPIKRCVTLRTSVSDLRFLRDGEQG